MQPRHGGRLTLRLSRADATSVSYEALLETPGQVAVGRAELTVADGTIVLGTEPSAPEWLAEATRALLRAEWRAHREDAAWPRRITRWRRAPDGALTSGAS